MICVHCITAQVLDDSAKHILKKIHFGMDMRTAKKELGLPLSQHVRSGDLKIGEHHNRRQVFVLKYTSDLSLQFEKHYTHFKFNKKAYLNFVTLQDSIIIVDDKKRKDLAR